MSTFYPINTRRFQAKAHVVTPDTIYWERLAKPELLKEHSTIDYVDFSPSDPDNFVLTCSVRVQIYNLVTKLVVKNLSRFQKTAYGATFRQDGRLLAAGDEEGHVKLFDTTSRNILRLFKGHKAPVHRTFFTADKLNIASFADDRSVRLWDVGNEKILHTYEDAHTDYVRAGAMHPQASNIFVSGGYDGKINLYDTRADKAIQHTLDHGSPVESMLFMPSGSIFISAGGTEVRVWDLLSGCRLLTMMSQHHKTVTCLRLGSNGRRLLSGGLDRQVKIYDVSSYKPVHTLTYPSAIVSLGVAAKDQAVVAGMVDGLVSIKRMIVDSHPSHLKNIKANHRHKQQQQQPQPKEEPLFPDQEEQKEKTIVVDHSVSEKRNKIKLAYYEKCLRKYNYKKALDIVMNKQNINKEPEKIVAFIDELLRCGRLPVALTDRPEIRIIQFIDFICKYVGDMRFMRTLQQAANVVLDVYEQTMLSYSSELRNAFNRLSATMQKEIKLTIELQKLKGALELIIGASVNSSEASHLPAYVEPKEPRMQPSKTAEKYVVYVE